MLAFTLRRILQTVPTIGAVVLLVFILFNVIPGTFATMQQDESVGLDPAVVARMRTELGLDDPLPVRFGRYIVALATLDLGTSFRSRQPVTTVLEIGRAHV